MAKDTFQSLNKKKLKNRIIMSETRKKYWTSIYYKFSDTVENAVQMF